MLLIQIIIYTLLSLICAYVFYKISKEFITRKYGFFTIASV